MSELSTSLRNQLAKVIIEARRVSEAGAQQALESLAVERHEPHSSMTIEERTLRNQLRARGRQLGDVRDRQRGNQSINRLTHEVAYEHWHRMLFARFLAENGLLIHPEHQVAMSLHEIEELAQEMGEDPHQMAAGFAQDSLPQIFRTGDPVLEVRLAPETRQKLESLLDSLSTDVFTADDSLGWTYQYWQSEKKDAVNASGEKIGADELPAVTQLFTEHYMVLFLYHNTIGAWHAGKVLAENPDLAETAQSEEELRAAVSLDTDAGKSTFSYLRFVREHQEGDEDDKPTGKWRPAAGIFEGWPKTAKELKVLDPCCGSGHFLVVGFKQMVRLRMHEEGLALNDAIKGVLNDNIFGLELDARCTQIAAFNLATAAWKIAGKQVDLPPLNIACSGLSIGSSKKDWLALADDDDHLVAGLENLYELFKKAPELGSLIDTKLLRSDMFEADFEELEPFLVKALARESDDSESTERAVAAQGMARAADFLSRDFTLVITNVPYLGLRKQGLRVRQFCESNYPAAKADLGTVMLERCLQLLSNDGTFVTVLPRNFLFKNGFETLRKKLLNENEWVFTAELGTSAFQTISGEVVDVALLGLNKNRPHIEAQCLLIDVSKELSAVAKSRRLQETTLHLRTQEYLRLNPNSRVGVGVKPVDHLLENDTIIPQGIKSGDDYRWLRKYWEGNPPCSGKWELCQTAFGETRDYGGLHMVVDWRTEGVGMVRPRVRCKALGKLGVAVTQTGAHRAALYLGTRFDSNVAPILPYDSNLLPAIWSFVTSSDYPKAVESLSPGLFTTNSAFLKVEFDYLAWKSVAAEKIPNGLPEPKSDDPTQWLFHGHPAKAEPASILQAAMGRLLGYLWPPELDLEMRLADEAREWVNRCGELKDFADEDGIVCLSATRGEGSAADRLRKLLAAAFGSGWSAAKEKELLAVSGDGKKPAASLEFWLRDKFFEEHCKLFQHRPFIWHIWDGNPSGFHCLVNAHKLSGDNGEGRRTLESITYSYMGDWIDRQKDDQQAMVEGADARLASALDLQQQLENILEGEPPYDLFVRWKPLHEQAIGWEPDINDGVRLNTRPFMNAKLRKGGKKGAGILRWKSNIKWKKDRGKEPQSLRPKEDFPWFWGCMGEGSEVDVTDYTAECAARSDFDGNRWNDLHYSRAVKETARKVAKEKQKASDK